jgi:hydrogenase maturation factor
MSLDPRVASPRLALGKPPWEVLDRLFAAFPLRDPRVIMGPRVGEDAAVLDIGDRYLIAKVDPITFVAEEIGWYAVHINANDLAVRGARPAWFLMTLLLPEGQADEARLEAIFGQVQEACRAVGASLVGGHTEVTQGLDRPILAGAMLLDWLGLPAAASSIRVAVEATLAQGATTPDLGGRLTTSEMADVVIGNLSR